jgi:hypothetical protein
MGIDSNILSFKFSFFFLLCWQYSYDCDIMSSATGITGILFNYATVCVSETQFSACGQVSTSV